MRNATKLKQGRYVPENPTKYEGNPSNIIFRSSWEYAVMRWCDRNPSVLKWQSEEFSVPYYFDVDQKWHRYFVDFLVTIQTKTGVSKVMIEVKPFDQTAPPKPPKRRTQKSHIRYQSECEEFVKNQCKWAAATNYAKERGWAFKILTEKELFNK